MTPDGEERAVARTALGPYLALRSGEAVSIEAWSPAIDWARAFVLESRRFGAEPVLAIEDEEGFFGSLAEGAAVPRASVALARLGGVHVYLGGPEAFPRLFGLRPGDFAATLDRHGGPWRAAARASGLRAVRMSVAGITSTAAARFGVNLDAWRAEAVRASLVPPRRLAAQAARLLRRLARARRLTVSHPNGTRLSVELRPGRWTEEAGRPARDAHRVDPTWTSLPAGRLAVSVASGSAAGVWEANRPVYDRFGPVAVGVGARFGFREGRMREYSLDRGGEALLPALRKRRQRRDLVESVSFGLNPRVARAPELGELELGTVGLRLRGEEISADRSGLERSITSLLHGATVELDGRPWLAEGHLIPSRASVRRTASVRSRGAKAGSP